jgi:hypothetical protein
LRSDGEGAGACVAAPSGASPRAQNPDRRTAKGFGSAAARPLTARSFLSSSLAFRAAVVSEIFTLPESICTRFDWRIDSIVFIDSGMNVAVVLRVSESGVVTAFTSFSSHKE